MEKCCKTNHNPTYIPTVVRTQFLSRMSVFQRSRAELPTSSATNQSLACWQVRLLLHCQSSKTKVSLKCKSLMAALQQSSLQIAATNTTPGKKVSNENSKTTTTLPLGLCHSRCQCRSRGSFCFSSSSPLALFWSDGLLLHSSTSQQLILVCAQ